MRPPVPEKSTRIYLQPGELYVNRKPAVVQTILGSCVAITMHTPRLLCGAICHALLPTSSGHTAAGEHVDEAIEAIYTKMLALGAQRDELVVKLFGGSRVLSTPLTEQPGRPPIGDQNIEQAVRILDSLGLPIVARDTGGDTGRKLFFYTDSGEVYIRKQRSSPALRHTAAPKLQEPGSNMTCRSMQ